MMNAIDGVGAIDIRQRTSSMSDLEEDVLDATRWTEFIEMRFPGEA